MVKDVGELVDKTQERSQGDRLAALVIAEHDKTHLKGGTANAITAAHKMAGDVHVLVAGSGSKAAADAAAKLAGVTKVLHADAAHYDGGGAENYAALVAGLAKQYSHVVASASAFGKGFMPRVAALLDVAQVSEISAVESAASSCAPIYAATRSRRAIGRRDKVVDWAARVRAAKEGGSATWNRRPTARQGGSRRCSRRSSQVGASRVGGARRVVSGGRGSERRELRSGTLADELGAAIALARGQSTRAMSQRLPVGQTARSSPS